MMAEPAPIRVYYDGACPICSREIDFYRARPGAQGFAWVDATSCDLDALGPGLTREAALARMHVRRPDGTLLSGAAAFAAMWRAMPGLGWLGWLVGRPGIRHLAELAYRLWLWARS